jgi:hypothetical protein
MHSGRLAQNGVQPMGMAAQQHQLARALAGAWRAHARVAARWRQLAPAALDSGHGDLAATTLARGGRTMGSHRCMSSAGESGAAATHMSAREEVARFRCSVRGGARSW